MELYVSEFSKYVITLLIALYTYESFAVFRKKQESDRNGIYTRQNILMFGLHFSCDCDPVPDALSQNEQASCQ